MSDLNADIAAAETLVSDGEKLAAAINPKAVADLEGRVSAVEAMIEHAFTRFFGSSALTEAREIVAGAIKPK